MRLFQGQRRRLKSLKQLLVKTLVVAGLPKDLTKNVLWKRVRKVNDAIELVFPVEGQEDTGR
jgi:nucleolar protein 4